MSNSYKIERSLSQAIYRYLPQAYADFDVDGQPITARVIAWRGKVQPNQNKRRIMFELYGRFNLMLRQGDQPEIEDFLLKLEDQATASFEIKSLKGIEYEGNQAPEILASISPSIFYCRSCGLVHLIDSYPDSYLKGYRYYIPETFNPEKHRCKKCNGLLKQHGFIRVTLDGKAYNHAPYCDTHKEHTEYYVNQRDTRQFFCAKCNSTLKPNYHGLEQVTPPLDPKVYFPQLISMVDLKEDDQVELISRIPNLPKLLTLTEFGVISRADYVKYRQRLIELDEKGVQPYSRAYHEWAEDILDLVNQLNEPQFETFEVKHNYYYENLALRLLELNAINERITVDFSDIIERNLKDNSFIKGNDLERLLNQMLIEKIKVVENVPINHLAYGYTRLHAEVTEENRVKLRTFKDQNQKNVLYSYKMDSEGVLIQFDRQKMLQWIELNLEEVQFKDTLALYAPTHEDARLDYFNNGILSAALNTIYKEVLHTASHALMKSISVSSGIEVTSLQEMIFPEVGTIFIYCNSLEGMILNSIKTAVTKRLYFILNQALNSIKSCNLKNICEAKEKQACLGCVLIPEIACKEMNHNLDRKLLSTTKERDYQVNPITTVRIKKGMWTRWQK